MSEKSSEKETRSEREKRCDPCRARNLKVSAVVWCTVCKESLCGACQDTHGQLKMSRDHKVVDVRETKSRHKVENFRLDEFCLYHREERLRFFCTDHSEPCCSICAVVTHRQCREVSEVEKLGKIMRSDAVAERLLEQQKQSLVQGKALSSARRKLQDDLNIQKKAIVSQVKALKHNLTTTLDELETTVVQHLDKLHQSETFNLQQDIEQIERSNIAMKHRVQCLESALSVGTDNQLFLAAEKAKDEHKKYEDFISDRSAQYQNITYNFSPNPKVLEFVKTIDHIGQVRVDKKIPSLASIGGAFTAPLDTLHRPANKEKPRERKPTLEKKPVVGEPKEPFTSVTMGTIVSPKSPEERQKGRHDSPLKWSENEVMAFNGRQPGDFVACNFRGIDLFDNGDIITVDLENKKLKLFNPKGVLLSSKEFYNRPYGVVVLHERVAAVTVKTESQVHFVSTVGGTIATIRKVKTAEDCFEVVNLNGNCAALCGVRESTSLVIIRENGMVESMSLSKIIADQKNLLGIGYHSKMGLFLCNRGREVLGFDTGQNIKFQFKYKYSKDLRGIAVDTFGNIYVAVESARRILKISPKGELLKEIYTGPLCPLDVAASHTNDTIAVCGTDDLIRIFKTE